ncbi:MAG: aminotransferase class V-fold PLP-dependent enzyme [Ardenticatenaceae bacterium]|nr:aminotransferase class V-fold PLP-dependent enzyme [Ardenticatenaceae bacterium]
MITPDFTAVRADFPRADHKLWLAAAETHPYSVHTLQAIERYSQFRALGPGADRHSFTPEMQAETKTRFAALINAAPEEIAFVQSTTDGENVVLAGLNLARLGGNVVIDDLHFEASKYMYTRLAEAGVIELRVVPHRNWQVNLADFEQAVDENTRLVSIALVSQVNGFKADVRAISELAHGHGAYLYCDMIQGAGSTPIDVRAMGIDFGATGTYKWLMGDFGLGFLYVRADLQGEVVRQTRYGLRQVRGMQDYAFDVFADASRYEGTSSMPFLPGVCAYEGLRYVTGLGVAAIRGYVRPLTDRLQVEMPKLGYQPITPLGTDTPIVSFLPPDVAETRAKLDRAFGEPVISFRQWYEADEAGQRRMVEGIRLGVSVYNNAADVEAFLAALRG